MRENKIKLRKVGIFSPQYDQNQTDLLQESIFPSGIEIVSLEAKNGSYEDLDLVLSSFSS